MAAGITFTGLGSGVDTNSIVTQLMTIERAPQQRLADRVTAANDRVSALQDVRTKLGALRTAAAALNGVGAFTPKPSAISSDPSRVAATANDTAVKGSFQLEVSRLARAEVQTQGSGLTAATAADTLHLSAGTAFDVQIAAGDDLGAIAGKINAAGGGITASVAGGHLRLTANDTGTAHAIHVASDGSLAGDLALGTTLAAADAAFTVDGTAYTRGSNTVDDVVPGVTLNLKGATGSTPVTLDVDPARVDADAVVGLVKGLVTAYNNVIDRLRDDTTTRPTAQPLTAADRARGQLFNDDVLGSLLERLQRAVTDPVSGADASLDQASEAGLSTGASSGAVSQDALTGRLVLDEGRLRGALQSDPDAVERLFGQTGATQDAQGLATRLGSLLGDTLGSSGALTGRLDAEARSIADWQSQSDQMQARLDVREATLRSQFTAMETALGQLRTLQSSLPGTVLGAAA